MRRADEDRHLQILQVMEDSEGYERRVALNIWKKIKVVDGHWMWTGHHDTVSRLPILNLWDDEGRMKSTTPSRWVLKNLCNGDFGRFFQVVAVCGERSCICPSHLAVTTLAGLAKHRILVFSGE